jgi:hypothetical protein
MKPLLLPFIPKERRLKPYLLLEISVLRLRLYSIDTSLNPIGINLLNEEPLQPGDVSVLIGTIKKILSTETVIRDLAIVLNSPMIHHQIIEIPPLNASRREKVLEMEVRNASTSNETPGAVSYWSFGKIKGPETVKEYVLCSILSPAIAEAMPAAVQEKDFNWIGFTSHAQIAIHLLKESRPEKNANAALVEVNTDEGSVSLFHGNIWNMERHFLLGASGISANDTASGDLNLEKLKLEVGRALQYFKQQVRNENISQIFLYGTTDRSAGISQFLESSFKIPVTPLVLDKKIFSLKDGGMEYAGSPLFTIPHTVALHADFKNYINFIPLEWQGKNRFKARGIALAGSALVLYALMGGFAYLFKQEAATIVSQEQTEARPDSTGSAAPVNMEQLQTDRQFARAADRSDHWQYDRNQILSELARELAGTVTDEMQVTALEVEGKTNGWLVTLDAEIRSSNGSRSQQLFLQFQDRMHRLSKLKQLEWKSALLADSLSPSSADSDTHTTDTKSLLTFTLHGILRFSPLQNESTVN